ncbi:restriction endonuclease [Nodularia sp. NIES-3585]|uniref:restriction endonuclease n=1 Tax=Nodularia sp. NIES-3585 TaxID=1973477 RepID=UPI000B5C45E7|nr:restriction endonuclease [Nodularia sp. NIES-3585]GAX38799.1 hypothetical protein NIES3585_48510 [Nodularia sp. NIES-3585]
MQAQKKWKIYEEVTKQLLQDIKYFVGISHVESKQKIQGQSGTKWEVDVIAYDNNTGKTILVECKNWKNTVSQETLGGFAYRIKDTDSEGGIIVTTIGLQEGASKIAQHEKITEIKLTIEITDYDDDYIAKLSNQIFIKLTDTMPGCSVIPGISSVTITPYKFSNSSDIEVADTLNS